MHVGFLSELAPIVVAHDLGTDDRSESGLRRSSWQRRRGQHCKEFAPGKSPANSAPQGAVLTNSENVINVTNVSGVKREHFMGFKDEFMPQATEREVLYGLGDLGLVGVRGGARRL